MKRIHFSFMDKVNHRPVYLYKDCYNDEYLSQNKYGYRVLIKEYIKYEKIMIKRILIVLVGIAILIFAPYYLGQISIVRNFITPLFPEYPNVFPYIIGLVFIILLFCVFLIIVFILACLLKIIDYIIGNK